jgi:GGDEF domain-containing protein
MYDPDTELIKFQYVGQMLRTVIALGQVHNKPVCLLLIQIADTTELMQERGVAGVRAIRAQVAGILRDTVCDADIPFDYDSKMGAILPETDLADARVLAERLLKIAQRKVRVALHVGVAQFPTDGLTAEELIHSAEAALQVSLTSGQPIFSELHPLRAVEDKKTVYSAGVLEMEVTAQPEPLIQAPPSLTGLPVQDIRTEDERIVVRLAEAHDEKTAGVKSTVEGEIRPPASPAPALTSPAEQPESRDGRLPREMLLGIVGLTQVAETARIEKAIRESPGVEKARMVEYSDGVLVMAVTAQPDRLIQILPSLIGLPVQDIRTEDGRIAVRLAETRDEKTAGTKCAVGGEILPASPAPPLTLPAEQPETRVGQLPREIRLRVVGLRQVGKTARIERAIQESPVVEKARLVEYSDGALIMEVTAQPDRLVQVLPSLVKLPVQDIRTGHGWIEVHLEETHA